jgi:sugar lactone lactonase YvrE
MRNYCDKLGYATWPRFGNSCKAAFLVCCLAIAGCFAGSGATAKLLSKDGSSHHSTNSAPKIDSVAIKSGPGRIVRRPGQLGGLVGRIIIEYTVSDQESDNVDLILTVDYVDVQRQVRTLSLGAAENPITEAIGEASNGGKSEGGKKLTTSPQGETHQFIWQSDWDIDQLIKASILRVQLITKAVFKVTVVESDYDKNVSNSVTLNELIDNRLVHSVAGVTPGQLLVNEEAIARDKITFDTISAVDTGESAATLYLADSGTHQIWSMNFNDEADQVFRVAGSGLFRKPAESPAEFDGALGIETFLSRPIDLEIQTFEGFDTVYVLEETGCIWSIRDGAVSLALDWRRFLNHPLAFVLDAKSENTVAYIADTGNCRIARYDFGSQRGNVVLGKLRELSDQFTVEEGNCEDNSNIAAEVSAPSGVALWDKTEARVLFISSTGNDRILRLRLEDDCVQDGAENNTPCVSIVLRKGSDEEQTHDLCRPAALKIIDKRLYIACTGVSFGGNQSKGAVYSVQIVDDDGSGLPGPMISSWQRVAGGLQRRDSNDILFDVEAACNVSINLQSTYRPVDECKLATVVPLAFPCDIVADSNGTIYIGDSRNQRVRKLESGATGECKDLSASDAESSFSLSTFVGGSVEGRYMESDDEFPLVCDFGGMTSEVSAVNAKISEPLGMVLVDDDMLLVCDRGNDRILRVNLKYGTIRTIAGDERTEKEQLNGTTFRGDKGPAAKALLRAPRSIAVWPHVGFCGNENRTIYIADGNNHRIRKIGSDGNIDTLVGTDDKSKYSELVRVDENGIVVERLSADPTEVYIRFPRGVTTDAAGRVIFSDCGHRIMIVDVVGDKMIRRAVGDVDTSVDVNEGTCQPRTSGTFVNAVIDDVEALEAQLNQPSELVFDDGEKFLYFTDLGNWQVRRVGYNSRDGSFGNVSTVAGKERQNGLGRLPVDGDLAREFELGGPLGLAVDPSGRRLFFSDVFGTDSIYRVELGGRLEEAEIVLVAGGNQEGAAGDGDEPENAQFFNMNSVQIDSTGTVLYVVDSRNHRIRRFFID